MKRCGPARKESFVTKQRITMLLLGGAVVVIAAGLGYRYYLSTQHALPAGILQGNGRIEADVGHIDIVFANAGFSAPAPLGKITQEHVDALLDTNVKGVIWTVQKALPLLRSGSSIVLSSSVVGTKGFGDWSLYSATKAAVRSFARTWTNELRDRHIRVNAISPGHIDTPIFESWQQGDALTQMKEELAKNVPLGRLGDPDEIAKAVAFLASDEASYISGIELFVDGGVAQI